MSSSVCSIVTVHCQSVSRIKAYYRFGRRQILMLGCIYALGKKLNTTSNVMKCKSRPLITPNIMPLYFKNYSWVHVDC